MTEQPRDECAGAIALFLEEQGIVVVWHNCWQFSVGGPGNQWVICVVDDENEVECIEFGPGVDNFVGGLDPIDPVYIEIADPSSFDLLLDLLRQRAVIVDAVAGSQTSGHKSGE